MSVKIGLYENVRVSGETLLPQSTIKKSGDRHNGEAKGTILLYTPDTDFSESLTMLLQDTYDIVATTEPDMLMMMVKSYKPDLVIADALPTDRMRQRFSLMKKEHPLIRIMMFYASSMESPAQHEVIRKSVDAAFSKPIELTEVLSRIKDFTVSVN